MTSLEFLFVGIALGLFLGILTVWWIDRSAGPRL